MSEIQTGIDNCAAELDRIEANIVRALPTLCPACGYELEIGDYPFCPHGSTRRGNALAFDPILVFEMPDGTHSYPGHSDPALCPIGGKPIFLDTLRKADEFVRTTNRREQEEIDMRNEHKRNHYDKAQRESRAQLKAELERRGISARNVDAIIADRDGHGPGKEVVMKQFEAIAEAAGQPFDRERAERHYEQTQRTRRDPNYRGRPQSNFQIEVFAQDASNRMPYRDSLTGWKARKG